MAATRRTSVRGLVAVEICIRNCARELDPPYEIDRRIVDIGRQSVLAVSLDSQGRQLGALWFDSGKAGALDDAHAAAIKSRGPTSKLREPTPSTPQSHEFA